MGGGLETEISGYYLLCLPSTWIEHPQVKQGLFHGTGDTQKLKSLDGFEATIEVISND